MSNQALTIARNALVLHSIENEQRVLDTDLAERLGFERPRKIRELINRKLAELQRYGICPSVGQNTGQRGRPSVAYYLNEEQALLVCMFSDTDNASNVRKQVIDTFMAVRRGQLQPVPRSTAIGRSEVMHFELERMPLRASTFPSGKPVNSLSKAMTWPLSLRLTVLSTDLQLPPQIYSHLTTRK